MVFALTTLWALQLKSSLLKLRCENPTTKEPGFFQVSLNRLLYKWQLRVFRFLNRFLFSEEKKYNIARSVNIGIYIAVVVIRYLSLPRGFEMFAYLFCPRVNNFSQILENRNLFKFQAKQVLIQMGLNWRSLA